MHHTLLTIDDSLDRRRDKPDDPGPELILELLLSQCIQSFESEAFVARHLDHGDGMHGLLCGRDPFVTGTSRFVEQAELPFRQKVSRRIGQEAAGNSPCCRDS